MRYFNRFLTILVICIILIISSCSSKTILNKKGGENWFYMYHAGGIKNVYRFSLIPLKQGNFKKSIENRYHLNKTFSTPNELINLLKKSGFKSRLLKKNGLKWEWFPHKYFLPITYYQIDISTNKHTYLLGKFIDQHNINLIKDCFVKYSKTEGTLSSNICLKKFIVP